MRETTGRLRREHPQKQCLGAAFSDTSTAAISPRNFFQEALVWIVDWSVKPENPHYSRALTLLLSWLNHLQHPKRDYIRDHQFGNAHFLVGGGELFLIRKEATLEAQKFCIKSPDSKRPTIQLPVEKTTRKGWVKSSPLSSFNHDPQEEKHFTLKPNTHNTKSKLSSIVRYTIILPLSKNKKKSCP